MKPTLVPLVRDWPWPDGLVTSARGGKQDEQLMKRRWQTLLQGPRVHICEAHCAVRVTRLKVTDR